MTLVALTATARRPPASPRWVKRQAWFASSQTLSVLVVRRRDHVPAVRRHRARGHHGGVALERGHRAPGRELPDLERLVGSERGSARSASERTPGSANMDIKVQSLPVIHGWVGRATWDTTTQRSPPTPAVARCSPATEEPPRFEARKLLRRRGRSTPPFRRNNRLLPGRQLHSPNVDAACRRPPGSSPRSPATRSPRRPPRKRRCWTPCAPTPGGSIPPGSPRRSGASVWSTLPER
jgi:hypothetical protein